MAHKTFSQEQFSYKFYNLGISFSTYMSTPDYYLVINSVEVSMYFLNYILRNSPYFSTNMFFIKRYTLIYYSHDSNFFSFFFYNNISINNPKYILKS